MFLITWLISMAFATVFGVFAVMAAGIVTIYRTIFNGVAKGGAQWSPENLFASEPLTQFKEFFTGGSAQQ
jgi:hypothetical protein